MTPRAALVVIATLVTVSCGGSASLAPAATPAEPPPPALSLAAPDPPEEPEPAPGELSGAPAWLGVELATVPAGLAGVLVRGVMRGSPAATAGLAPGDRILTIDGRRVDSPAELVGLIGARAAGERAALGVRRGEAERLLAVRLAPRPSTDELMRKTYVGLPAPSLGSLKPAQGSLTPRLAALRGKVVVVEFWASWCMVCRVLAPTMNAWQRRYAGQGVELLGITTEPVERAALAASQLGMAYPIASDDTGRTSLAYRATALPTLFVIDRAGVVRDVLVGYSSARLDELQALLDRLVEERIVR
ncbi:MAG: redoxin domain-containing protein [Sorangiineae bacterium]|nr:redoxin domain-containing protein [Polyangiaceae bacterium]MEB2323196.1 redoxin domain-containing protein [Sorangiineae bacterium]